MQLLHRCRPLSSSAPSTPIVLSAIRVSFLQFVIMFSFLVRLAIRTALIQGTSCSRKRQQNGRQWSLEPRRQFVLWTGVGHRSSWFDPTRDPCWVDWLIRKDSNLAETRLNRAWSVFTMDCVLGPMPLPSIHRLSSSLNRPHEPPQGLSGLGTKWSILEWDSQSKRDSCDSRLTRTLRIALEDK